MTATLTQASLAYNDEHLVNRIRQAVSIHKKCFVDEMMILEIIASTPIGDNATIASAYEYHWVSMLQSLGKAGRVSRVEVAEAMNSVGRNPLAITDSMIVEAVEKVELPE